MNEIKNNPYMKKNVKSQNIFYISLSVAVVIIAFSFFYYNVISKPQLEKNKIELQKIEKEHEFELQKAEQEKKIENELELQKTELENKNRENKVALTNTNLENELELQKTEHEFELQKIEQENKKTEQEKELKYQFKMKIAEAIDRLEKIYIACKNKAVENYEIEWEQACKNNGLPSHSLLPNYLAESIDKLKQDRLTNCANEYKINLEIINVMQK